MNPDLDRDFPDGSQTGVSIRVLWPCRKTDARCARLLARRAARMVVEGADLAIFPGIWTLCVAKTSSALISRKNNLTSAHHDRAAMFRTGRLGLAIQVEEPA
jgi:hypothetical protein